MQAKWSSLLFLVLLACFVESSSGQQAINSQGSQNQGLPPIVQARDFRFSQRQITAPQQAAIQQPAYQQNRYQQAVYPPARQEQGTLRRTSYEEAREQSILQATYPQAQNLNQYGTATQQGMVDAQIMLTEQRWQQMRNEQTARLAMRQNGPAQRLSQTNRPQYRSAPPAYQSAPSNPYAQELYARRYPPTHPAVMTQAAQEEDPFGSIQDPFGDPVIDDAPGQRLPDSNDDQLLQQPDPFRDTSQQPIDPFADPPAQEQAPQEQLPVPVPDPFADQTVPDVQPEQPPMQEPTAPAQELVPTPPAEPTLPGGILDVPQIPSDMQRPPVPPMQEPTPPAQELVPTPPAEPTLPGGILDVPQIPSDMQQPPVPPMQEPDLPQLQPEPAMESYPPEAVIPPSEPQETAPTEPTEAPTEPTEAPTEPSPAPQTPEARPMQPGQLYPGQIPPPAPSTQRPTTQTPMNRSTLDSNVGSPGPYMPQSVPPPYFAQPNQQQMMPAPYFVQPNQQQMMPAPYLVQPNQQQMMPAQPYVPPRNHPQMAPARPYSPPTVYQQLAPSATCDPTMSFPQMAPAQPYTYPSTDPGVSQFTPPQTFLHSSPGYPNPSPAIAGGAAIEAGSYFDRDGSSCPSCSAKSNCSCAECSSCNDTSTRPFYVSIFGGGDYVGDLTSDDNQTFLDFDTGGGVGIALGKVQGNNLRTDLEFTYRNSSFGPVSNNAVLGPIDGEFNSYSGMANAYWEFAAFPTTCWKPYFGGGVGFVFVDPTINSNSQVDSDSSFAYQWMVGLNYKFSYRTDLFVEYREFYANDVAIGGGGLSSDIDFQTSNVFGGFRLKF